jgi:hypothetical protein
LHSPRHNVAWPFPHDELIVRPKITNFIQALPSQGSKHLSQLEND